MTRGFAKHLEAWRSHRGLIGAVPLLFALLAGCASDPRYFRKGVSELENGGSVAVLPLVNLSKYESASDIIVNTLVIELLDAGMFDVVDPGLVETVVLDKRLRLTDRLSLETLQAIGQELSVSHVIVGSVNEFGFIQEGNENLPTVSISLRLVTCANGRIVWAAAHSRRGDDAESVFGMGKVGTLEQLAQITVKDMTDTLRKNND